MYSVIPLCVGLYNTFHDKVTSHGIFILTFHDKEMVIIGIAIVTLEVKIPFVIYIMDFG